MARLPTLVLGASMDPERYSNKAMRQLGAHGHPVIAVGARPGAVEGRPILTSVPEGAQVDTVTLYLAPRNQEAWRERILALRPRRLIFNPGAENPALAKEAEAVGIEVVEACTLVLLATGQY